MKYQLFIQSQTHVQDFKDGPRPRFRLQCHGFWTIHDRICPELPQRQQSQQNFNCDHNLEPCL